MSPSDFDPGLEELRERAVGRLLMTEVFDRAAFVRLRDYLREKSKAIRAEHVVSKQVVFCLLDAASSIENSSFYVELDPASRSMAREFRGILDAIARGEACNEREPGVPRIL